MGCPEPEQIAAVLGGRVSVDVRGDVLDHAASCATCHALLIALDGLETDPALALGTPTAASAGEPRLPAVGDVINRYEITGMLGAGAMGVVYRARDRELGRNVALKVLKPGRPAARLRREAQTLARLDAPNVIAVYDVGEHAGAVYLVMELVEGKSLRGWLETPHTTAQVVETCIRAGAGLAAAHRAGVVHRDFKPDNVLVAADDSVHVGDFGLAGEARVIGALPTTTSLTATGTVLGTPAYMAPEQLDGDATALSDQYAFCVTVWEALTGKRPFDAPTVDALFAQVREGTIARPARPLPARIEAALRRGLSRDPAARFPDMTALLDQLATPIRRWPWIAAGLAVAAGAVIAIGVMRRDAVAACTLGPDALVLAAGERDALDASFGTALRGRVENEIAAWQRARGDACALHDAHRLTCLTYHAARIRSVAHALGVPKSDLEPALGELRVDAALARCLAIPQALAPALAVFDVEAARLDALIQAVPAAGDADLERLRAAAKSLGDAPQLRVRWIDAWRLARRGDHTGALAALPTVIADADRLRDDDLRARASALFADVLARSGRVGEARSALEQARASWQRVGDANPMLLATAEIAIAVADNQHARAAERAEALVEEVRARYPNRPAREVRAIGDAITLWVAAGDLARANKLRTRQRAVMATEAVMGMTTAENELVLTDTTALTAAGGHRESIDIDMQKLVILRRVAEAELARGSDGMGHLTEVQKSIGYTLNGVARTYEMWGQPANAVVWFRNLSAFVPEMRDEVVRALLRVNALEGEVRNLIRIDQPAAAIEPARTALELTHGSTDAEIADAEAPMMVSLGRALFATGNAPEARKLLEAVISRLEKYAPFTRGVAAAYLAYALWETGGERDRDRARALAADAEKAFSESRVVLSGMPALRPVVYLLDRDIETLARWRKAH